MLKLSDAHRRRLCVRRARNQYRRRLIGGHRLRQDEIPVVPNSFEWVMRQLRHSRIFATIPFHGLFSWRAARGKGKRSRTVPSQLTNRKSSASVWLSRQLSNQNSLIPSGYL